MRGALIRSRPGGLSIDGPEPLPSQSPTQVARMKIHVGTAHGAGRHAQVDFPSLPAALVKAMHAAYRPLVIHGRTVGGIAS
jgi:fructose/tagatose bisphosphate aldolase